MRTAYPHLLSILLLTLVAPIDAVSQSEEGSRHSKAMNPRLSLIVRDYLSNLPLQDSEASKFASGDPYFTYVGGDTAELGIAAHQFPTGSVVLGIQTLSSGL
ncbi:MAG: hypothetical protein WBW88_18465, partial [Rhodothermales bacterium]